jgi:hypothetical protein
MFGSAALGLGIASGCGPQVANGGTGHYVADANSPMIGAWQLVSGTKNESPLALDARVLTVAAQDGRYTIVDGRGSLLQSGDWGVDGNEAQFSPRVAQGEALWSDIGNYVAQWTVQQNALTLEGLDGQQSRLTLILERR